MGVFLTEMYKMRDFGFEKEMRRGGGGRVFFLWQFKKPNENPNNCKNSILKCRGEGLFAPQFSSPLVTPLSPSKTGDEQPIFSSNFFMYLCFDNYAVIKTETVSATLKIAEVSIICNITKLKQDEMMRSLIYSNISSRQLKKLKTLSVTNFYGINHWSISINLNPIATFHTHKEICPLNALFKQFTCK